MPAVSPEEIAATLRARGCARDEAGRARDLLASLMAIFGTNVDLVRMETAPSSLVERVRETGEEL